MRRPRRHNAHVRHVVQHMSHVPAAMPLVVSLRTPSTRPARLQTASRGDLEPINDLPRLGGVVTHLAREVPVRPPEFLNPVAVAPPLPFRSSSPGAGGGSSSGGAGVGTGGGGGHHHQHPHQHPSAAAPEPVPVVPAAKVAEMVNMALTLYAIRVGGCMRMVGGGGAAPWGRPGGVLSSPVRICFSGKGTGQLGRATCMPSRISHRRLTVRPMEVRC